MVTGSLRISAPLRFVLEDERQARGDEDDAVGERRDVAVEAPGMRRGIGARARSPGTMPSPTSFATSTTGPGSRASAATSASLSAASRAPGLEHVRKPERQAINQHRLAAPHAFEQRAAQGRAAPRWWSSGTRGAHDAARCAGASRRRAARRSRRRAACRQSPPPAPRHGGSCPSARRPAPRSGAGMRRSRALRSPRLVLRPRMVGPMARQGGLLARGHRSRHLPSVDRQWLLPRPRRSQLRGQRRHFTGLPCLVARTDASTPGTPGKGRASTTAATRLFAWARGPVLRLARVGRRATQLWDK